MSTFLLVPGAWLGGWCWRYVASDLRAIGHTVIPATLTGLGERAHLLSRAIGLDTHISDIVGLFGHRDLHDVILVGHSYGGTVITGVAERVPDRIRRLVYLDASVPRDGESNDDVIGPTMAAQLRASAMSEGEGWKVPPAPYVIERLSEHPSREWVTARLRPHPLRPFAEPVRLSSEQAVALPRAFVQTTQSDLYRGLIARARQAGWHCQDRRRPLCDDHRTEGDSGGAERDSHVGYGRVGRVGSSRAGHLPPSLPSSVYGASSPLATGELSARFAPKQTLIRAFLL